MTGHRPRLLFAWELGANFGHSTKISQVAYELAETCEIFVAARDPAAFRRIAPNLRATLLPAPFAPTRRPSAGEASPANYAAILSTEGWDSAQSLHALIEAWRSLFSLVRVDMLVAQAAPTAQLAARGLGFPVVVLGSGYDNPPLANPMPPFDRSTGKATGLARAQEASVLAHANEALANSGSEVAESFRDIVAADLSLLMAWAFSDHYFPREEVQPDHPPYLGQLLTLDTGAEVSWSGRGAARILAYLRPGSPPAMSGLAALHVLAPDHDVILAAPGISERDASSLRSRGARVVSGPVRLDRLLPDCDLGISHASNGIVGAFASAGVPQVGLPNHREQAMCARTMAKHGLGLGIEGRYDASAVVEAIRSAMSREELVIRARGAKQTVLQSSRVPPAVSCARVIANMLGLAKKTV